MRKDCRTEGVPWQRQAFRRYMADSRTDQEKEKEDEREKNEADYTDSML